MPSIRTQILQASRRLVLLATIAVLAGMSFWQIRQEVAEYEARVAADIRELAERADVRITQAVQASEAAANLLEASTRISGDEALLGFLERVTGEQPLVSSAAVVFNPEWAAENRRGQPFSSDRPILFVYRDSTSSSIERTSFPFEDLPMEWEDAFNRVLNSGNATWTEPYFDDLGAGIHMITYIVPFKDRDGSVVGVVSTDIGQPQLESALMQDKLLVGAHADEERRLMLMTEEYMFFHHPDTDRIGSSVDAWGEEGGFPARYLTGFPDPDEPSRIHSEQVGEGIWWVGMRGSGHILLATVSRPLLSFVPWKNLLIVVLAAFGLLLMITPALTMMVTRLSAPLSDLSVAAERIGRGEEVGSLPVDREDELGELARAMETMTHEIRERQRLEAELVREQAGKQEREKFEQLFHAPTDGVVFIQDRVIVEANRAMATLLGYDASAELMGKGILSISASEQSDGRASADAVEEILGRVMAGDVVEDAWLAERKDGSQVPMRITVFMGTYEGRPALLCTLKDVTELQAAIDRAEAAARTIERMSREQQSFVRHELNNAIAPLLGYSEMLDRNPEMAPDARQERIHRIHQGATATIELLHALRDLQAIERGDHDISRKPVDVVSLLEEEISAQEAAGDGAISISFRAQTRDPFIQADPAFLPGVFRNLIKNAVEHVKDLPADEQRLSVAVGEVDDGVGIVVANGGTPIPVDRIETFFEKFNSTKKDSGGTGLGTSYAHTVVTAHGGRVGVKSSAEEGTRVRVWLPRGAGSDLVV